MQLICTINGTRYEQEIAPDTMLLDFLRSKGFFSVKQGCDTGNCGLCTVWLDQRPVLSCSVLAARAQGAVITTTESALFELLKKAGTAEFKKISKLVK